MNTNSRGCRKTVDATVFKLAVGVSDIVAVQYSSGINSTSEMPYLSLNVDLPLNQLYLSPPHPSSAPMITPFGESQYFLFFLSFSPKCRNWPPLVSSWGLLPSLLYCFNFQKPCAHILLPSLLPACAASTRGLGLRPRSSDSTLGGLLEVRWEEKSESLS